MPEGVNEIKKKIDALPPEIKTLIYSTQMDTAMQQIGAKNQLHIDQIGALESEVVAAMIGISPLEDLPANLIDTLGIDKAKSDSLVNDINEQLLDKIRNSMKQADTHITSTPVPSNPPAISAPLVSVGNKTDEKSVVMPSAAKAPVPAASQPAAPTIPLADAPTPPMVKPAGLPAMPHVDAMLSQPTVSIAPKPDVASATPPTPAAAPVSAEIKKSDTPTPPPIYKTDPYHEPID